MLTRTAIYEGALTPGTNPDTFFAAVREKLEPIWSTFPEVLTVRVHRITESDPGAIPILMILEMDFTNQASLTRSLASDIKTRSHALTLEVLKPFKSRFFKLPPRIAAELLVRTTGGTPCLTAGAMWQCLTSLVSCQISSR